MTTLRLLTLASALAGFSALCPLAGLAAQAQAASASASASATDPAPTIAAARKAVRERYVLPEVGDRIDAALAAAEQRGDFAGLAGEALALKLTEVMHSVTPDGHLNARFDPPRAEVLAQAAPQGADDDDMPPQFLRMIALNNGGVEKLELMPGNMRYLNYTGFMWGSPAAESAIVTAMEFLRGGDAIIIDLRANGGGSPDAVAALASYFVPAETPLMRFEIRGEPTTSTTSHATPFSLADKPVFVLTSGNTFSAAEEFAAHVQAFGFATLVGEPTGGGGFRNTMLPLPGGLVLSVSIGQALQAKTGKEWERTGIAPAIAVPAGRALDRAKAEAMTAIAARAPNSERPTAERVAQFYRAVADGAEPARGVADYAGAYGERIIAVGVDGALTTRRGDRLPTRLVALGTDLFAPETAPMQHFRFVTQDGAVVALEVDSQGGPQRAERSAIK